MWEAAAANRMPVAIHTSDPEAFFLPTDRFNERYEELSAHPDWSFHGRDFPSDRELQEARLRVIARHPRTQFVALHVANSENLPYVSECLDRHKNMHVEIGARIGELGRQPGASRKFFEKYQDRILFGTDAPSPTAKKLRNRSSATSCTRSTTASSRPRTSTSTTRPRRCRPRAAGGSTASACRSPS